MSAIDPAGKIGSGVLSGLVSAALVFGRCSHLNALIEISGDLLRHCC